MNPRGRLRIEPGMPVWMQAGFWGLVGGSSLLVGAALGVFAKLNLRTVALVMAFGSGVLISALSFDLMDEALSAGGATATAVGFLLGAALFTLPNRWLNHRGASGRKDPSGKEQPDAGQGGGAAIALGALIDGIPESVVIGVSLLKGGAVSVVAVVAVFLSNLPEALSSASGMRRSGRSTRYVFGVWGGIALASGVAAAAGAALLGGAPAWAIALANAIAAGAILAMLVDTMLPEAFEVAQDWAGVIVVLGFLAAFLLSKTVD